MNSGLPFQDDVACAHVMVAAWALYGLVYISGPWGFWLGEGRRVIFCFVFVVVCLLACIKLHCIHIPPVPQRRKVHDCTAPSQSKATSLSWQSTPCLDRCGIIRKKMTVLGVSSKVLAHPGSFWNFMLLYPSVLPPRLPGSQMHPGPCILMQ